MTVVASPLEGQLRELRALRNSVIGSRTRKGQVVLGGKVPELILLLRTPLDSTESFEVRALAATIIGSLAHSPSSPTLLSLLRAGAPAALIAALADLAELRRTNAALFASADPLKALESLLRSLRSILIALADEVAPDPRYGLGIGRDGSKDLGPGAKTKSWREPSNWAMAQAGFSDNTPDEDTKMSTAVPSGSSRGLHDFRLASPREELTLLARSAIAEAFSEQALPVLLGAVFLSPIPRDERADKVFSDARAASRTRLESPVASMLLPPRSRESSRSRPANSSLVSAADSSSISDLSAVGSESGSASMLNRGKILAISEMVFGILSVCLPIAGPNPQGSAIGKSAKRSYSAAETDLIMRKRRVMDFQGRESAFTAWSQPPGLYPFAVETVRAESLVGDHEDAMSGEPSLLSVLLEGAECGFSKTQETALWALAELTREGSEASVKLFRCHSPSGLLSTAMLLSLRKDSNAHVRLAAYCCLAHIIKVHPFTPKTNEKVLGGLIELLEYPGEIQIAAAFAIAKVVADDPVLQCIACEKGYDAISKLGTLLNQASKTSLAISRSSSQARCGSSPSSSSSTVTDNPAYRLQEAALTALAALTFSRDHMRRQFIDFSSPPLLPLVVPLLTTGSLGTRVAACRLVRALSRSISILRTSLVDAGVSEKLIAIIKNTEENVDVKVEATATICNLVLSFAPMRQFLMENGGISKLVELCASPHGPTRLNALWAIKNVIYASETAFKEHVMKELGYSSLTAIAEGQVTKSSPAAAAAAALEAEAADEDDSEEDDTTALQEQALNIIRNLASSREVDIEATFAGFGGATSFFELLESVIWQRKSDLVTEQAAYILVNIATGSVEHRRALLDRPNLLDALCYFATHPRSDVRVAAVWAAMNLTQHASPTPDAVGLEAVKRLRMFGFAEKLDALRSDPERDVSDRAKALMSRFE
ncbi:ARM repeat-containing protein [Microstroma glucosiphilum]|uniref:ARM repeat-containing protein n=1 Tax=Pseudomicrostroma glucosiphilum TaxID=1684307 RepID=A0A316UHX7_9BASI|nr:ARM repeat-containing protein [Pseudomicrostroma glucosiphilum]PWN22795.1 ARM repeat-containing protein [Pseudomicrostroma glucosiphilum]